MDVNKIHFKRVNLGKINQEKLQSVLSRNTTLLKLDFENSELSDDTAGSLCEFLRRNETVTRVRLGSSKFTDAGLARIFEALATNNSLSEFDFQQSRLTDASIPTLLKLFDQARGLHINTVSFAHSSFTDAGFIDIVTALCENSTLKNMRFGKCTLTDHVSSAIAAFLRKNGSIIDICFQKTFFNDDGLSEMLTALRANTTLCFLSFEESELTDGVVQYLCKLFHRNKLVDLWIPKSEFTDKDVSLLVDALNRNCTISCIRIGEELGSDDIKPLVAFIDGTPHLETIKEIDGNPNFVTVTYRGSPALSYFRLKTVVAIVEELTSEEAQKLGLIRNHDWNSVLHVDDETPTTAEGAQDQVKAPSIIRRKEWIRNNLSSFKILEVQKFEHLLSDGLQTGPAEPEEKANTLGEKLSTSDSNSEDIESFTNVIAGLYPEMFKEMMGRPPNRSESDFSILNFISKAKEFVRKQGSMRQTKSFVMPELIQTYPSNVKRKSLEMENLLVQNGETVILSGEAGIGKTTFMKYQMAEWANNGGEHVPVFPVNMELFPEVNSRITLSEFLTNYSDYKTGDQHDEVELWARKNPEKMIIWFDSLNDLRTIPRDKIPPTITPTMKLSPFAWCHCILQGSVLPGCSKIVCARSKAVTVKQFGRFKVGRIIRITELTEGQIKKFINESVVSSKRWQVEQELLNDPILMDLSRNTSCCSKICSILQGEDPGFNRETMTYTELICCLATAILSPQRQSAVADLNSFVTLCEMVYTRELHRPTHTLLAKLSSRSLTKDSARASERKPTGNDNTIPKFFISLANDFKPLIQLLQQKRDISTKVAGMSDVGRLVLIGLTQKKTLEVKEERQQSPRPTVISRKGKQSHPERQQSPRPTVISRKGKQSHPMLNKKEAKKQVHEFLTKRLKGANRMDSQMVLMVVREAYESQSEMLAIETAKRIVQDKGISITKQSITSVDMRALIFVMKFTVDLEVLRLRNVGMRDNTLQILQSYLADNTTIKELELSHNTLTTEGILSLQNLNKTKQYTVIKLDGNNELKEMYRITSEGSKSFSLRQGMSSTVSLNALRDAFNTHESLKLLHIDIDISADCLLTFITEHTTLVEIRSKSMDQVPFLEVIDSSKNEAELFCVKYEDGQSRIMVPALYLREELKPWIDRNSVHSGLDAVDNKLVLYLQGRNSSEVDALRSQIRSLGERFQDIWKFGPTVDKIQIHELNGGEKYSLGSQICYTGPQDALCYSACGAFLQDEEGTKYILSSCHGERAHSFYIEIPETTESQQRRHKLKPVAVVYRKDPLLDAVLLEVGNDVAKYCDPCLKSLHENAIVCCIFTGNMQRLIRDRPVVIKYRDNHNLSKGRVSECNWQGPSGSITDALLIKPDDQSEPFCKEGDSGSVLFLEKHHNQTFSGKVYSGHKGIAVLSAGVTGIDTGTMHGIAFRLDDAMDYFENKLKKKLYLWQFHHY